MRSAELYDTATPLSAIAPVEMVDGTAPERPEHSLGPASKTMFITDGMTVENMKVRVVCTGTRGFRE
jgi:hypothetical protein